MDRPPEGRLLHATALVRAKEKGDSPGADVLRRAMAYLRGIEEHIPGWYGPDARRAIRAYALHVRWLHGETVRGEAMRLIREAGGVEKMPLEAFGWLWPTLSGTDGSQDLVRAIRRHVENNVHETDGAAHFVTSHDDRDWLLLHSSRRTDAVLLEAMIREQANSSLIPKLVKGLLAQAFASILYAGVWDYSYLAVATTPGSFVAPPPKAEEMYAPEVFGRGPQERVVVE